MSASVFAGDNSAILKQVSSSETVQSLVTTIAAQSFSGDPVYCSFDKIKLLKTGTNVNQATFSAEVPCGPGMDAKNHMMSTKVKVSGFIEDSQVFVKSVSIRSAP